MKKNTWASAYHPPPRSQAMPIHTDHISKRGFPNWFIYFYPQIAVWDQQKIYHDYWGTNTGVLD